MCMYEEATAHHEHTALPLTLTLMCREQVLETGVFCGICARKEKNKTYRKQPFTEVFP